MTPDNKPDCAPHTVPAHVNAAVVRVEQFLEHKFWGPAFDAAVGVLSELDGLGADSAYVRWLAAIAADSMGRVGDAVGQIARARVLDTANSRAVASEDIILNHVVRLVDAAGPDDAEVQAVLGTVRRNYSSHPCLQRIDDKLAELAARSLMETERRPRA